MAGYNCTCSRCGIAIRLAAPSAMGPTVRCSRCESLYGVPPEPRGVSEARPAPSRLETDRRPATVPVAGVPDVEIPLDAEPGGLTRVDDGWAEIQRRQRKKALAIALLAIGVIVIIVAIVILANSSGSR